LIIGDLFINRKKEFFNIRGKEKKGEKKLLLIIKYIIKKIFFGLFIINNKKINQLKKKH
jgi:hypothetical protein